MEKIAIKIENIIVDAAIKTARKCGSRANTFNGAVRFFALQLGLLPADYYRAFAV